MAHLVETLIMPPVGNLVLVLLGLALVRGRRRLGRCCMLLGLGSLLLMTLPVVSAAILISLQTSDPLPPTGPLPEADAIVILGADFRAIAPEMGGATVSLLTLERLRYGARLARRADLPVLVSGGSLGPQEPPVAVLMRTALQEEFDVAVRWAEKRSLSTRENAHRSAELLAAARCGRILLVTHAWHMPRARRAFERAGLEVIPAPMGIHIWPARDLGAITPFSRALLESTWGVHEWVGRLWYRLTE